MISGDIKKILDTVKTKEDLDILKHAVLLLEQALYKEKGERIEEVLNSELPRDLAKSIREVISATPYKGSISKIADLFTDFKKAILRIRVLGLDLAFYPSEKAVGILYNWARREVGENIVLDFNIDRGVIGGVRIVYAGRYGDYSLARMIEHSMAEERERILGMVAPQKVKS